ncbi:MAG: alcohol dehydrogenase catalytic domain-containing protein [Bacteroidota bacterium]
MKAALLTGIRQFEIGQVPDPEIINDTDVLIRIKTVGVCGSDIHYYTSGRIGSQIVQFPFIIGHETAGTVEKIGKKVTRVKPGQRVAIDPAVSCGRCDQCKAGRENTCREIHFLGTPKQLEGCLREFIVLHEKCCFPIKDSMTFEQAALSEPLSIAVYSVEKSLLPDKASAAILGVGPIGMSLFHVLRTKNAGTVYVTDKIEERLAFSKKLHPRWSGNPNRIDIIKEISKIEPLLLDVVYECSGDEEAIGQAVQLLKPGGALVLVGIPETDEISFSIHELRRKEITIINIRRQVHCTQKAIDLLALHQINMDSMVTHRFPLEETKHAFDLVENYRDGVMKAIISID